MYQFTTDQIRIQFPETLQVSTIDKIVVTLAQKSAKLEKDETEVTFDTTNNKLVVDLTQAETGAFAVGWVAIQCHMLCGTAAHATKEMQVRVYRNLHGEVIG